MTLILIFGVCVGVLALLAGGMILSGYDFVDDSMLWVFVAMVLGIAALVFGVLSLSQHYDRVSCSSFARTTGRETKFVHYNTFSWDCLTPTANGKWIPTSNLREFGGKP